MLVSKIDVSRDDDLAGEELPKEPTSQVVEHLRIAVEFRTPS